VLPSFWFFSWQPLSVTRSRQQLGGFAALIFGTWWLWPSNVYRYQDKTVEEWFEEFRQSGDPIRHERFWKPFQEMGTNAAPFLVSRITQNLEFVAVLRRGLQLGAVCGLVPIGAAFRLLFLTLHH
jgi:hypothetical protein